jgi:hypothetical protein
MIAAVDARKSTEQSGVADEEPSVTRQVEHMTAYATAAISRSCSRVRSVG